MEFVIPLLGIIFFIFALSVFIGVPFLPTHRKQAEKMIELAELKPGMTVIDLGSGAGRLLFMAEKKGVRAIGYELNPFLFLWTKLEIMVKGLSGKVDVRCKSLYDADLKDADVVMVFLFPKPMKKLAPKLTEEMKPGSKIISYVFDLPGKEPTVKEEGIFVYKM